MRRRNRLAALVHLLGFSRQQPAREQQHIVVFEPYIERRHGNCSDRSRCAGLFLGAPQPAREHGGFIDPCAAACARQALRLRQPLCHGQAPFAPPEVDKINSIAGPQQFKPGALDRNACRRASGLAVRRGMAGLSRGIENHSHRLQRAPQRIAPDPDSQQRLPAFHGAGSQLWPSQIHQDAARVAGFTFGAADVANHGPPRGAGIVSAVDACAIHPVLQQLLDKTVIGRSFGRQRHHEPRPAVRGWRAEQQVGMTAQERLIACHRGRYAGDVPARDACARHLPERMYHRIEGRHDMPLAAAKRRQPELGKMTLDRAQVVAAQGDIGGEVCRARQVSSLAQVRAPVPGERAPYGMHRVAQRLHTLQ